METNMNIDDLDDLTDKDFAELARKYNEILDKATEYISEVYKLMDFSRLSKSRTWKKKYSTHSLLLTLRQLRWLTTTLELRVIIKGVPGFLGMNNYDSSKLHFGKSGSIYHIETCCVDYRSPPHPEQPFPYCDSGINMESGIEKAISDIDDSIKLLDPVINILKDIEGIESFAKQQIDNYKSLFSSDTSYPWYVMSVIEARRGNIDKALSYINMQCERRDTLKKIKADMIKYINSAVP